MWIFEWKWILLVMCGILAANVRHSEVEMDCVVFVHSHANSPKNTISCGLFLTCAGRTEAIIYKARHVKNMCGISN
jgi:uncharacterized cupin superfamily protein